ncbi:predicted protein [Histoplasma capsulatum var. duboisii H88]|uniref:Predicted protein n=2 Tax=Ajellomyces capsulatus TaxID=5037 RepID=F0UNR7_AJEC8|nr:predicted protein [Histoplasma capsulatum H143]EGC46829.1 predicted protein [Histoplasma capsulatum var. duboisii H88]
MCSFEATRQSLPLISPPLKQRQDSSYIFNPAINRLMNQIKVRHKLGVDQKKKNEFLSWLEAFWVQSPAVSRTSLAQKLIRARIDMLQAENTANEPYLFSPVTWVERRAGQLTL